MNNKKNTFTNLLIALSVIIIICVLGFIGKYAASKNLISFPTINLFHKDSQPLNNDALYLSPPITVLYAAKITGKSTHSLSVDVVPVEPPKNYEAKILSFSINLSGSTEITKPNIFIPYSLKKIIGNPPRPSTITLKDLSIGDYVDITLTSDLRTTKANELQAKSISQIYGSNLLTGSITKVNGDSITVLGIIRPTHFAPTPAINLIDSVEKTYTITINPDTELVTNDLQGLHKLTSSDLKIGNYLTIYADAPITGSSFSAAMISVYSQ